MTDPPPTCGYPVGGQAPCGAAATAQTPWSHLYGYEQRTDVLPLCPTHALRFPDATPL